MRSFIIFLSFFSFASTMIAQRNCAFDQKLEEIRQKDRGFDTKRANIERKIADFQKVASPRNGRFEIPVVFHLLRKEGEFMPPRSWFDAQLVSLNKDFSRSNDNLSNTPVLVTDVPTDMGVSFCLASVDPDGNPTDGFVDVETNYNCIGDFGLVKNNSGKSRLYYDELGGSTAWDEEKFINIWVAPTCNAFAGFGSFPSMLEIGEDGVVIDPKYIGPQPEDNQPGYPFHLGKTLTHEMGHYFDLRHVWGEGGCDSDDFVLDTPLQEFSNHGCEVYPSESCGVPDYFFNFMDYSDDECLTSFTHGQRQRLNATISLYRSSLVNQASCNYAPVPTSELLIFPNPAHDVIYLNVDLEGPITVEVFDSRGVLRRRKAMMTPLSRRIDLKNIGPGIYYLRVIDSDLSGSFLVIP